jgi:hypothetical protein
MAKQHRMALMTAGCAIGALEGAVAGTKYTLITVASVIAAGSVVTLITRARAIAARLQKQ